jgi:hypothetical protein
MISFMWLSPMFLDAKVTLCVPSSKVALNASEIADSLARLIPDSFSIVGTTDKLNFLSPVGDGIVIAIFWFALEGVWGTGSPDFFCVDALLCAVLGFSPSFALLLIWLPLPEVLFVESWTSGV